jgi:hypothetical protein
MMCDLEEEFMIRKTAIATAALLALGLVGCASDPNKTDLKSITGNLTPELMNTSERPVDVDVNWAMNANQDLRSMWNDLGRFWLTDKPSALSPYPIQPTGGQP